MVRDGEFRSGAQWARDFTERWWAERGYCFACHSDDRLEVLENNAPCWDFRCRACGHPFQLKGSLNKSGTTVQDGSYKVMTDYIRRMMSPTFVLLRYTRDRTVPQVAAVHCVFITKDAIVPRKPLTARPSYVMCSVRLADIPMQAKISVVENFSFVKKDKVREQFQKLSSLENRQVKGRGWMALILNLTQRLPAGNFRVDDLLAFRNEIEKQFPDNRHVREKVRQQLQFLRNAGLVQFVDNRGTFRLTGNPVASRLLL